MCVMEDKKQREDIFGPLQKNESSLDFYYENGYKVFTEEYHKKRGFCCGNGCRHCCFEPKYVKYNTQLSVKN